MSNPAPPRYRAFISYNHRDTRWARWLQHALETYRLPRQVRGRDSVFGPLPERLRPVFRDRDELPAGADLTHTVRGALEQSSWLLIVCSPAAAASPWVEREIVEFKRLHGAARVLGVIVGGEPNASRLPGRESEECFPRALRHALDADGRPTGAPLEPVAVDLRPQGDGKRLALLKLVAGMTGLAVDELAQRDAQRRARRMTVVAAASFAGMLAAGALAWVAVQARQDAEFQRSQAEGLIEFMLGDLRKKLDSVGRLDIMNEVGDLALKHYDTTADAALGADAAGRRARSLHLIGEVAAQQGRHDTASAAFARAAAETGRLLATFPEDPQRIFEHAQSVYWVGYADFVAGRMDAAGMAFQRYADLAQRLLRLDPGRREWRMEAAWSDRNIAVVAIRQGRPAAALDPLIRASDEWAALAATDRAALFELARDLSWLSDAYELLGQYRPAADKRRAIVDMLAADASLSRDPRAKKALLSAEHSLGLIELSQGRLSAAHAHALRAVGTGEALVRSDESNLQWCAELLFARLALSEVQWHLGQADAARSTLARVQADLVPLLAGDAVGADTQILLQGAVLVTAATVATARGRVDASAALVEQMQTYLARFVPSETGACLDGTTAQLVVARVQIELGRLLMPVGRHTEAYRLWRTAAHCLRVRASPSDYRKLTELALVLLELGEVDSAHILATQIQRSDYRSPAYTELKRRLSRGAMAASMERNSNERNIHQGRRKEGARR